MIEDGEEDEEALSEPRESSYLVDTSALVRLLRDKRVRADWREKIGSGRLMVCPVTELEIMYSAQSLADRETLKEILAESYLWVFMPDRVWARAGEVQECLTELGRHRSAGPVDLLTAATAEEHNLVLLHYDADFLCVAAATGQPVQWLADRGSLN
ncbi:PIN domain nuclease [Actinoplanes sp. NPDC049596]|uniref:PIN domain nuclease n=1 Tax=unclassified Actinoplanes TaxID=2626549 RepID=UPI00341426D8